MVSGNKIRLQNKEIPVTPNQKCIGTIISINRSNWLGNAEIMDDLRIPKGCDVGNRRMGREKLEDTPRHEEI